MKIKRQICLSNSRDVISPHRLLRVTDGGLECTSIEEAKEKFGIVQIGTIPTVTSENTIDLNVVPSEVIYPTIIGPSTIEKGRSYKYTIRNFDSVSTTYNVSVDEGSVSRVDDVITIINKNSFTLAELNMFLVRLIYPSYFFNIVDDKDFESSSDLFNIIKKSSQFENFLKELIINLKNIMPVLVELPF